MNIYQETEYFEHHIRQLGWEKVTHCRECKYFTRDTITGVTIPGTEYCIFTMNNRIEEDDFCSWAVRKEE